MLQVGDRFGDYTVLRLLGQGGMGSVFLLKTSVGGRIAAKILYPERAGDHTSRRRFVREAQLALGLKHPSLVETYDVGEDPDTGLCYILMEYVSGGSLADRIGAGPLPVVEAIRIVCQIASALEFVGGRGIVHRDIKPANIMFGADGTAKLADLGIARDDADAADSSDAPEVTETMTQTGAMIGTPAYMAPEQMLDAHHVDSRADIFSLGIVFYEMLAGRRPYPNNTAVQLMAKAVAGEPIPDVREMRPDVPAAVARLVSHMCAMRVDERIATPTDVLAVLSQVSRRSERSFPLRTSADPNSAASAANRPDRLHRAMVVGLVAESVLGALLIGFLWVRRTRASLPIAAAAEREPVGIAERSDDGRELWRKRTVRQSVPSAARHDGSGTGNRRFRHSPEPDESAVRRIPDD